MDILTLSNVGLIIDFVAAGLIFFYGFPVSIDLGGINSKKEQSSTKSHTMAKLGFFLLAVGFALQLVGNLQNL